MNLFIESIGATALFFYYWLESIVLFFVPASFRRKDVSGQKVLITGAGNGLGRLMAQRFAEHGCTLILWDINKELNEETASLVKRHRVPAHTFICDLSDKDDIYAAAAKTKEEVGEVDILVNNAGIVTGGQFLKCSDRLMVKCMEVNTMAHFWTTKSFLPGMLQRNKGHIVSLASAAGLIGVNSLVDYCTSKFGAVGFDESIRQEIAVAGKDGVKTTCICPFYINTGMFAGVSTRFPALLPILEPEYAVDRIMDAVLTDEPIIFLPRLLYVLFALKNILPVKCITLLNHFFGASSSMDDFVGRQKKE
ncbi:hypothetical protein CAPTEDRAFT_124216 [Capitella teleta]|uniref:Epidermal retinol dehydrogenase 2 n=1 Tax=Capitella teleta TaxID=283909 RepID=R7U8A3_CAPTE|nr:hypothetical protein CAPTEDRAFT_124216 [Capitella teleta]|eukprot:ELT99901.1 hypothetical protein CAPTEDRAFT_124216 [Capitella teleta]